MRFYNVAMQVAAHAARSGHGKLAQELRDLVDRMRAREPSPTMTRLPEPTAFVQPRGELAGLLAVSFPETRLADLIVEPGLQVRIERVLLEQRQRERLAHHGFEPTRKLLFAGPPGTGKTMTASVLAGELGLPLFTVQLDALITRFLGETASKLRLVFEALAATRGVYFFDEFDAVGGQRTATNDVGEIRRVLNSFLQLLEADRSESLLIAATNHQSLLDRALFRRFDHMFGFALPGPELVLRLMRDRLATLDTHGVAWGDVASAADGLSQAEVTRAALEAAKHALLDGRTDVTTVEIAAALSDRRHIGD